MPHGPRDLLGSRSQSGKNHPPLQRRTSSQGPLALVAATPMRYTTADTQREAVRTSRGNRRDGRQTAQPTESLWACPPAEPGVGLRRVRYRSSRPGRSGPPLSAGPLCPPHAKSSVRLTYAVRGSTQCAWVSAGATKIVLQGGVCAASPQVNSR